MNIQAGDIVILDGGFTCHKAGEATVHSDDAGRLHFICNEGRHYLDGQLDEDGNLVGITTK